MFDLYYIGLLMLDDSDVDFALLIGSIPILCTIFN